MAKLEANLLFPVHINDGTTELPKEDIFYSIGKDGIYIYKKIGIVESFVPVKQISFLKENVPMVRLHVSKIPASMAAKVVGIFRAAYEKYKSEAAVILFYNETTKKHRFVVPKQEVSSASVTYERNNPFTDWTMLGTIHSHASMNAFHSGTDVNDEANFDGLHITFGDMDEKEKFTVAASIVSNGTRVVVDPSDYVDGLYLVEEKAMPVYTSRYYKYENGKFVEVTETKPTSSYVSTRRFFSLKTSKKNYSFEADIMTNITEKKWTYAPYVYAGGRDWKQGDWQKYYNHWGIDDYSEYYGAEGVGAWEGYGVSPSGYPEPGPFVEHNTPVDKNLPVPCGKHMPIDAIVHGAGMKIIDTPDDEFNICSECIHRDEKLEWALEHADLIDNVSDEDFDKLDDNFLTKDDVEELLKDQSPAAINDEAVRMLTKHRIMTTPQTQLPLPRFIPRPPVPIRAFGKDGRIIPFITKVRGKL